MRRDGRSDEAQEGTPARLPRAVIGRDSSDSASRPKLAEVVAAQIERHIISLGWPVGRVLGSEAGLMETYGVSRSVLREAVRLLEHHLVAETRRGRNGGLVVAEPDSAVVTNAVALYLQYHHVTPRDLFETRASLELTAVGLAVQRATPEDAKALRELAELDAETPPSADLPSQSARFHVAIAAMSGNPAIHLFVEILAFLTESTLDHASPDQVAAGVHAAHQAIAKAVATGDVPLAERRMASHFAAMASSFR